MSVTFISSVSHKFFTAIVVVALALGSLQVTPAYAATITVTTTADEYDVAPGNGFCSLREAIANANSDALTRVDCPAGTGADTITLTSGFTYALTLVGTTATTGDLDISDVDGLIIQASGTTAAIIDANDIDRVIDVSDGNLTLNMITVTNGTTQATSSMGGGIRFGNLNTGTLTVIDSTISNNVGVSGGGGCGGGIYNSSSATINITNSTIVGNTCAAAGSDGGGLWKGTGGTLNITNSTFYGNSTDDDGGGARINAGTATILFSTFSNNSTAGVAGNDGGGLQIDNGVATTNVTITSSILANNTPHDCEQSGGAIVTLNNTLVELDIDCGTESFFTDPGLGALANNGGPTQTMSISGGVAFNAATSCGALTTDQRGYLRPQKSTDNCDLGAFELQVNDEPSFTAGSDVIVLEDSGAYLAGWATGINDGDSELIQTLTFNVSNNNNPLFSIQPSINSSGTLTFTPAANASGSATVSVYLTDDGGTANGGDDTSPTVNFTITVTAVNDIPADIVLSANSIAENNAVNAVIGALSTTDPDAGDTFIYSLACAVAGADDASFNINAADLRASSVFDFETQNSYAICIRTTDQGGLFFDKNFTITITDVDEIAPSVTITSTATNPTNTSPIPVTITFSEAVTGFVIGDITVGNGTAVNFNTTDNITFTLDITPAANGFVTVDVAANVAQDASGNNNTAAIQFSITYDNTVPSVTITSTATNPTNTSPIPVTITFSEGVTGFVIGDITVGNGTAGNFNTTDNITFTLDITPTTNGLVTVDVAANVAQDASGNNNTTAIQFSIIYAAVNPVVVTTSLVPIYTSTGPGSFMATFNKDVDDPAGNTGADDVTNPANYLLVNKGTNSVANTVSCAGGVATDDTQVTVTSVVYNNITFTATVTLASPLPIGSYRLFICGTTSIVDLAGNPLNGGTDYTFDFIVQAVPQTVSVSLPDTGFPQNEVTTLPLQSANKAYASTDLWLEIPKLGVKMSIVGVSKINGAWDVTWLDRNAGWLDGSAFPTWNGNSVLTGHVWDALNKPGPFAQLKSLKYGDLVKIHAFGQIYTYEIRVSQTVLPTNLNSVFKHEDKSWITLVTCEDYKEKSGTYAYRRMVRAVLVSVTKEK